MYTLKGRGKKEAFRNLRLYSAIFAQNPNSHHGRQQQSGCVRAGGERLGWWSESSDEGADPSPQYLGLCMQECPKCLAKTNK
ncbi:hypothetical protein V5799_026339 [Amblyomma americanum]|uniref:Uncharacterized protein n=1 Tax=Amblyomma americanum TaxID=6943 RepID=A0AAQ4DIV5_AMBAM